MIPDRVFHLARCMFIAQAEEQGFPNATDLWGLVSDTGQDQRWLDDATRLDAVLRRLYPELQV